MASPATTAEGFYSRLTEIGAPKCETCRHHHRPDAPHVDMFDDLVVSVGYLRRAAPSDDKGWACALCGASGDGADGGYKAHERGEQHMRAGAALSVQTAEMGLCPWCPPDPETKKLVRLSDCWDTSHAASLHDCREVVSDKVSG